MQTQLGTSYPLERPDRALPSRAEDLTTLVFATWLILGVFIDGFAHNNLRGLESFFTPWHGILYSGFLAVALWLAFVVYRNLRAGYVGARAIPVGYELGVLGAGLFGVGGLLDLLWHTAFGVEQNVDALYSPVHLLLISSGVLIGSSPLRSSWASSLPLKLGWRAFLPAFLSLLLCLSAVTFIVQQFWMLSFPVYSRELPWWFGEQGGVFFGLASVSFINLILFGAALLLLRRFVVPLGTFTLLFGINTLLMSGMIAFRFPEALAVGFGAGLLMDALYALLRPSPARVALLRLWAFLAPMTLWGLHFLGLELFRGGTPLSLEMWTGLILTCGLGGLLLSVLVFPPALPAAALER